MSSDNLARSLPPELQSKYLESSSRMAPGSLRRRFGLDEMTEEPRKPRTTASQQAASYAAEAMKAWTNIHQAHWSSMADATTDKRSAFLRSAQYAKGRLEFLDRMHAEAAHGIEEKAKHLATVLGNARKPPTGYGDAMIDAEVRAMIRAEADPIRAVAIARAHPRAVASLPDAIGRQLVGDSTFNSLVRDYLSQVEPEALADQDDLRSALTQLTTAGNALSKEANALIDFDTAAMMAKQGDWKPTEAAA